MAVSSCSPSRRSHLSRRFETNKPRSYTAFFTDIFCILDFTLVMVDLVIIVLNVALAGLTSQYPFLKPIGDFASNGHPVQNPILTL